MIDIQFLLKSKLCPCWVAAWWLIPFILLGITGWWLRYILREVWSETNMTMWPILSILIAILLIVVIFAAIAVSKEEQYNFLSVSSH